MSSFLHERFGQWWPFLLVVGITLYSVALAACSGGYGSGGRSY